MDAELNIGYVPDGADLVERTRQLLNDLLTFAQTDPPPEMLKSQSAEIMAALQIAAGIPEVIREAVALVARVYLPFERLGLWQEWPSLLFNLYANIATYAPEADLLRWFETMAAHYLYTGNPAQFKQAMDCIREIAGVGANTPLQEANIDLTLLISPQDNSHENLALSAEVLRVANRMQNKALVGKVYSVLSMAFANHFDPYRAFEYGQMAYSVGRSLRNKLLMTNGLHYMAVACQMGGQKALTFKYLKLATAYNDPKADVARGAYLQLTWGSSHLTYHEDALAEEALDKGIALLGGRGGTYYAHAVYLHGLALTRLGRFDEAKDRLVEAGQAFKKLDCWFNTLAKIMRGKKRVFR